MTSLAPAVQSLSSSLALLKSATDILDSGVSDYPRLTRVLSTQQHFELLPEPQLRAAQQSLEGEIAPAISQLLATADKYVDELARRDDGLKARYELLTGRLESGQRRESMQTTTMRTTTTTTISSSVLSQQYHLQGNDNGRDYDHDHDRSVEAKLLRQKKERLQYAIDRLELQTKQRERALRKSMAAVS